MRAGFTGTQAGMDDQQRTMLLAWLILSPPTGLHHGDCVGADAEAHTIALGQGVEVVIHPPEDESRRAFCQGAKWVEPPAPYLVRNRAIVQACDVLIAAPRGPEVRRSGTWATIRYARSCGVPVVILHASTVLAGSQEGEGI